jgi:hypothetical protein
VAFGGGEDASFLGASSAGISRVETSSSGSAMTAILVPTATPLLPSPDCMNLSIASTCVRGYEKYHDLRHLPIILSLNVHLRLIRLNFEQYIASRKGVACQKSQLKLSSELRSSVIRHTLFDLPARNVPLGHGRRKRWHCEIVCDQRRGRSPKTCESSVSFHSIVRG